MHFKNERLNTFSINFFSLIVPIQDLFNIHDVHLSRGRSIWSRIQKRRQVISHTLK